MLVRFHFYDVITRQILTIFDHADRSMLTPMPLPEQIEVLRAFLRTLRADSNRAIREAQKNYRKRRVTPFVERLRSQRIDYAWELRDAGEECLRQLRKARALYIAEWRPGDQIIVETVIAGYDSNPRRYVVTDVDWSKPDSYHYDVWQLTKAGRFYERGGQTWVFPSDRISITRCNEPLPEETEWQCASYRSRGEQFLEEVRDRGNIDHIIKWIREKRARGIF